MIGEVMRIVHLLRSTLEWQILLLVLYIMRYAYPIIQILSGRDAMQKKKKKKKHRGNLQFITRQQLYQ